MMKDACLLDLACDTIFMRFLALMLLILALELVIRNLIPFILTSVTYAVLLVAERKLALITRLLSESSEYFSTIPSFIIPSGLFLFVLSSVTLSAAKYVDFELTIASTYLKSMIISNSLFLLALSFKCAIIMSNWVNYQREKRGFYGLYQRLFVIIRFIAVMPIWYNFFASFTDKTWPLIAYVVLKLIVFNWLAREFTESCLNYKSNKRCDVKKVKLDKIPEEHRVCIICMCEPIEPVALQCEHVFCYKCLERWMESHNTCPFCRNILVERKAIEFSDGHLPSFVFVFPF